MILFVLIPVGVSEQAAAGVFSKRWKAKRAAKKLWAKSDGYHTFEVHEMEVDKTYESFSLTSYFHRNGPFTERPVPEIEVKVDLKEFEG